MYGWIFDSNPDCIDSQCTGYYSCDEYCQTALSYRWIGILI